MAPLRASRCADPVGEVAPCWQLRQCRYSAVSLGGSSSKRSVETHVAAPRASGARDPKQQSSAGNEAALRVLVSRELLEHISDFVRGVPSLLTEFVEKNGAASNATGSLSPFHDGEGSYCLDSDEQWSACYDPQAANGLVTRLALERDDRHVLSTLLRLHQLPVYRRMRKLRLDMAIVWSVELGRLQTLRWLQPRLPAHVVLSLQAPALTVRLLSAAIGNGDVEMLHWVQRHCAAIPVDACTPVPFEAIQKAPKHRVCEILRWLHTTSVHRTKSTIAIDCCSCRGVFSLELVNHLAELGCLDAIQLVHTRDSQDSSAPVFSAAAMDIAAGAGNLDIVQFLHFARSEGCTTVAMDAAAQRGHVEIVQFLHEHRREGCTVAAMDTAAASGHLAVVQFLHSHRSEGCSVAAMDQAARNGHLDVTSFLSERRREGCTSAAMDQAALFGHAAIVQFLHESTAQCTTEAMDNAARAGHLAIVQFLHEHCTTGCTTAAMDLAAQNGHLEVVQFLHEHRREGATHVAMTLAAQNGHLEIVQFLHTHRQEGCTKRALSLAARNGFARVVRFLLENRREGCAEDALRCAYRSGRFEVARYLHQRGFMGNVAKCVISCCCPTVLQYS